MIDKQLAEAWGRITGEHVYESTDPLSTKTAPVMRWYRNVGRFGERIPDVGKNPWLWLTKFDGNWWEDINPPLHRFLVERGDTLGNGGGDTPEAALEAAIRDWATRVDALEELTV